MELLLTAILIFLVFLGICKIIKLAKKVTIAVLVIVMVAYLVIVIMSIDLGEVWLHISAWLAGITHDIMNKVGLGG